MESPSRRSLLVLATVLAGLSLSACASAAGDAGRGPSSGGQPSGSPATDTGVSATDCPATGPAQQANSPVMIDWMDLVVVDGHRYAARFGAAATPLAPRRIGATIAYTRCRIADSAAGPQYTFRDGDATFAAPGTGVHSIVGVPASRGVAVRERGQWTFFAVQPG